ncbi:hypothetical protein HUN41_00245 [Streptomyces phage Coruscant]|uniref:Uncharacterized protein n=1 Tax=Streptomyces phage Coruscant TaxID=2739834 RepID=A0A7G4AWE4_9CAUD|nr:hypothetical protein PP454_gp083 [Streptomyces phage Coruscant]QMP84334.1 hypothetical protein HUN41_00245 [Streptomyces phage Coruscant]
MHREIQVVLVTSIGVYGTIEEQHAFVSKVKYSLGGIEYNEYFDNDDIESVGQIGYEET